MSFELKELLEAGAHFGHQTKRWNPRMKPYIYGVRNGIHIIDLSKTLPLAQAALAFLTEAVGNGQDVLFAGTKRQAQDIVREEAERIGMYYINDRWLGGTLTNFKTIKASIDRLHDLQKKKEEGYFATLSKKENLNIDREIEKLEKSLGGIKNMARVPGVIVLVDPKKEKIALHEAAVLGIPVVAMLDTNCDPENIDYPIPCNDDSIRTIRLVLSKMVDAIQKGLEVREQKARANAQEQADKKSAQREQKNNQKSTSYVSKPEAFEASEEIEGGFSASAQVEEKTE